MKANVVWFHSSKRLVLCDAEERKSNRLRGKFLSDFKFLALILKAVILLPNLQTFQRLCECLSAFVREKSLTVEERERNPCAALEIFISLLSDLMILEKLPSLHSKEIYLTLPWPAARREIEGLYLFLIISVYQEA